MALGQEFLNFLNYYACVYTISYVKVNSVSWVFIEHMVNNLRISIIRQVKQCPPCYVLLSVVSLAHLSNESISRDRVEFL